jgi:hypothetical protein
MSLNTIHFPVNSFASYTFPTYHFPIRQVPVVPTEVVIDLYHTPAFILKDYLTGLGIVGDVYAQVFWPCYVSYMPDVDGNIVSIYDTTPVVHHRVYDGMYNIHYGIQIIIKSEDVTEGAAKMEQIFNTCEKINKSIVAIDSSTTYIIGTCAFSSGIIYLGREWGTGRRSVFSLNLLCTIGMVL